MVKKSTCQCRRLRRLGFDPWAGKSPWGKKWHPTPVFLPRESLGQRRLVGSSPCGHKELDTTERLSLHTDFGRREKEGRDERGKESRSGRKEEGEGGRERTPRQDVLRNYTACHFHSLRNRTVCGQFSPLSKAGGGKWLCVFVMYSVYMCVSVFVSVCVLECVCVFGDT